jgi:hypothetical protein
MSLLVIRFHHPTQGEVLAVNWPCVPRMGESVITEVGRVYRVTQVVYKAYPDRMSIACQVECLK